MAHRFLMPPLLAWLCLLSPGLTQAGPAAPAYEAKPFLEAIRKPYRTQTQGRMGIRALNQLPLYQMEIALDALRGKLVCQQEVFFRNPTHKPLADLVFRLLPNAPHLSKDGLENLTVLGVSIDGQAAETQKLNRTSLRIALPQALKPDSWVRVGLRTEINIPRLPASAAGPLGATSPADMMKQLQGKEAQLGYGIFGTTAGVFNLGYFYPVLASLDEAGWDTALPGAMGDMAHAEVANFLVKITAPQNMVVVSSGIQVGENPLGSGADSNKETFLVGAAVRNFALQLSTRYEKKEKTQDGIRVRFFYVQGHEKEAENVLTYAAKAVSVYQRLFGPYPWPELDVAEAPLVGGAGGVEYPGLITVAMQILSDQATSPTNALMGKLLDQTQMVEFVVAHEVAHQWWHGMVGSDSSAHPFIDEAMTNYATVLYFEASHGQAKAEEQLRLQLAMPYQVMRMMGIPDNRVDRPTSAFSNQIAYSGLVYGKGALFYHALRRSLGKKRFLATLRRVTQKHAFRQIGPRELANSLAVASGQPQKTRALYQRWIEGRHGDQDVGMLDMNEMMQQLMNQMQQAQGFHNMQIQGLDPATLQLFQQALQGLSGGP